VPREVAREVSNEVPTKEGRLESGFYLTSGYPFAESATGDCEGARGYDWGC
jgi:hypothetical protein